MLIQEDPKDIGLSSVGGVLYIYMSKKYTSKIIDGNDTELYRDNGLIILRN